MLSSNAAVLKSAEAALCADPALAKPALFASGIQFEAGTREQMMVDGIVQGGDLVSPPLHGIGL